MWLSFYFFDMTKVEAICRQNTHYDGYEFVKLEFEYLFFYL